MSIRYLVLCATRVLLATAIVACGGTSRSADTESVLLFVGAGTSRNDADAFESILKEHHISYATANSRQLDEMSEQQLQQHRLLIVPGGNFVEMGNGLSHATAERVRNAVGAGLHYLGICAGAFLAGNSPYNGLNLTAGVRFNFYSAENLGVRKAAVDIAIAGAPMQTHYWEDGPQLSGWGDVVATYADGTPAIVEGSFGAGQVILTGTHPEAPERWRRGMHFAAPAEATRKYAGTLIEAAIAGRSLAHY